MFGFEGVVHAELERDDVEMCTEVVGWDRAFEGVNEAVECAEEGVELGRTERCERHVSFIVCQNVEEKTYSCVALSLGSR